MATETNPAARIFKRFRNANSVTGLPAVSVLGPRFAGKSQCLKDVDALLRRRGKGGDVALSLVIDLEMLGTARNDDLAEHLIDRLYSQLPSASRLRPDAGEEWKVYPFAESLRHVASQVQRATVILIDHIDTVPVDFARALVRAFRVVFDQRDVFPEYRKLGVVFSGSLSLSLLKKSGESSFVSEVVVLPQVSETLQLRAMQQSWPFFDALPSDVAGQLAALTRGERIFVDLVRSHWANHGTSTDVIAATVVRESEHPVFRELTIALFTDKELWDLVVDVLDQGDGLVPRRDFTPDCDLYSLSGAVVIVGAETPAPKYAFRNGIIRAFVASLRKWRVDGDPSALARGIRTLTTELEDVGEVFDGAPDVWDAMEGLRRLWRLLGNWTSPPDVHLHLVYRQSPTSYWFSQRRGVELSRANVAVATQEAVDLALDGDDRTLRFGYDTHRVSLAYCASDSRATLVIAITYSRSEAKGPREHMLSRWQSILAQRARLLMMCALAEASHVLVAQHPNPGPQPVSVRTISTVTAGPLPGRADAEFKPLLRQLAERLAQFGHRTGNEHGRFLADLLDQADIPDEWKRHASSWLSDGTWDTSTWNLMRWLFEQGSVPNTGVSALAVVLEANARLFGQEDRTLFCDVLEAQKNAADAPVIARLRASV